MQIALIEHVRLMTDLLWRRVSEVVKKKMAATVKRWKISANLTNNLLSFTYKNKTLTQSDPRNELGSHWNPFSFSTYRDYHSIRLHLTRREQGQGYHKWKCDVAHNHCWYPKIRSKSVNKSRAHVPASRDSPQGYFCLHTGRYDKIRKT